MVKYQEFLSLKLFDSDSDVKKQNNSRITGPQDWLKILYINYYV
jgi:hypothetical protein